MRTNYIEQICTSCETRDEKRFDDIRATLCVLCEETNNEIRQEIEEDEAGLPEIKETREAEIDL